MADALGPQRMRTNIHALTSMLVWCARPHHLLQGMGIPAHDLIAKAAGKNSGSAGPYVQDDGRNVPLRDWLCDSLVPMAQRDARRLTIVSEVTAALAACNALPADADEAARLVDAEVRERVRQSGRCNVSRAVSDLVRAGLIRRHYQGYRVDHHNRWAQREAVYTITEAAASALS